MNDHGIFVRLEASDERSNEGPILRARDMRSSETSDEGGMHIVDIEATRPIRAKKNFRCQVLNRICTERPQFFHTLMPLTHPQRRYNAA
jgi:hypothetical protein